ncbi:hypothetical protein DUI87_17241 [Hirundo rustica rustica]|uniref:Uncharacterized protein n=1 Tax=Hirundo rustica rustica TaxID=333673 RepID=A0A3M0JY64_HIRRU|nr:hypothetical protein DUI87_17241 [Hirundo rustica rustica]
MLITATKSRVPRPLAWDICLVFNLEKSKISGSTLSSEQNIDKISQGLSNGAKANKLPQGGTQLPFVSSEKTCKEAKLEASLRTLLLEELALLRGLGS